MDQAIRRPFSLRSRPPVPFRRDAPASHRGVGVSCGTGRAAASGAAADRRSGPQRSGRRHALAIAGVTPALLFLPAALLLLLPT